MPKKKETIIIKPKLKRATSKPPFLVYALRHTHVTLKSYTGQTNCFERRIRQHRGERSGGARYTRVSAENKGKGTWHPIFHVTGFQTLRAVLQMEIAMKKRKVPVRFQPGIPVLAAKGIDKAYTRGPSGRVRQLEYILSLGRLNDEPHSDFAANGIGVKVLVSKDEYLKLGKMTEEQFEQARARQLGILFSFPDASLH